MTTERNLEIKNLTRDVTDLKEFKKIVEVLGNETEILSKWIINYFVFWIMNYYYLFISNEFAISCII